MDGHVADTAKLARRTDREEFEELVAPLFDLVFGFALRMTRNRADAEDLVQESLYRAFRGLAGFERGTNFKAWIFRIVTNTFISRKRSAARAPALLDIEGVAAAEAEPASSAALEDELIDASTDWRRVYAEHVEDDVKRAIDDLPEEFRIPLLLSGLGGLRYQEIADAIHVPIGTVMSRLFRARQRLKRALRVYAAGRGIDVALDESTSAPPAQTRTRPGRAAAGEG
jgi:RNA polymerase sigma-70 factor (ECF subfamily)